MKNEPLPLGQITPVAKPIGAFAQPGKRNVKGAAKPTLLGQTSSIIRQQKMQVGNVQGYNNFQELAQAIGTFTPAAIGAAKEFHSLKKLQDFDIGYQEAYNSAKNEGAKALINIQDQIEFRATQTNNQQTKLEGIDPVAASLLNTLNPDRLAGRRKALSQIAATELGDILDADLANNAELLSTLKPGSGELLKRKSVLTRGLQQKYGLTGDEPEYAKYFVTELNKSWDTYSDKHEELYNAEVDRSTRESTVALIQTKIKRWSTHGIEYIDPKTEKVETIMPGDPRWATLGGAMLTHEIDSQLSLLAGKRRTEAINDIREQIVPLAGMYPGTRELMGFVRGGSKYDDFATRPLWKDLAPWDMLDMTNKGLNAVQELDENVQNQAKISLNKAWWGEGGPGWLQPDTPEYQEAVKKFRQMGIDIGYRDIDKLIDSKTKTQRSFASIALAPTGVEIGEKEQEINLLGPEAFEPENIDATYEDIKSFAAKMPTAEEQTKVLRTLNKAARDREKFLSKLPPDVKTQINRALKFDLGKPEIKSLKGGGLLQQLMSKNPYLSLEQAVGASGDQKLASFMEGARNGMTRAAATAIDKWYNDNPDASAIPADIANTVTANAIAEYRKSEEYKNLLGEILPEPKTDPNNLPSGKDAPDAGDAMDGGGELWDKYQWKKPVNENNSSFIPTGAAKQFRKIPIMKGEWLYRELGRLQDGKPYGIMLKNLAKRANTSPDQFVLDQLKFYAGILDPDGSVTKFISEKMTARKQQEQLAINNHMMKVGGEEVKNRHWGNWLIDGILGIGPAYGYELEPTVDRPLTIDQNRELLYRAGGVKRIENLIINRANPDNSSFNKLIEHQYENWSVLPDVPFEQRPAILQEQMIRFLTGTPLRNENWGLSDEEWRLKVNPQAPYGEKSQSEGSFDISKLGGEIGQIASTGNMKGLFAKGPTPPPPIEPKIEKGGTGIERWNKNWPTIYNIAKEVGIKYPEIVAAQFGQESKWGKLETGKNNYLGIKATQEEIDNGQSTLADTWEEIDGKKVKIKAHFKNFDSIRDALLHYKKFWNDDYKDRKGLVNAKSREDAVKLLKANGYATDSKYVKAILEILSNSRNPKFGPALY